MFLGHLYLKFNNYKDVLYTYVPKKGTALIFNHDTLHAGEEVTSGVKYLLRTGIMFKQIEDLADPKKGMSKEKDRKREREREREERERKGKKGRERERKGETERKREKGRDREKREKRGERRGRETLGEE